MRLKTPEIKMGRIVMGGKNPVVVQSMTNTDTADVKATVKQCEELIGAGAEMVRITVNNEKAAPAVEKIRRALNANGYKKIPLVGDFHYNGHILLKKYPDCARALDKYRINPGNVREFDEIIKIAIKNKKPVRIGVNSGSVIIPKNMPVVDAMVNSATSTALRAEKLGLKRNMIILSVKMTDPMETVAAYRKLKAKMIKQKRIYALHVGVTEA
ncbi:MAG: flavodoxin-dependent (E)-4-hydroxy-3-methylbut-2-enyl-diphosphate synthase, partial [Candidatus Gracilibacteria bacterium]